MTTNKPTQKHVLVIDDDVDFLLQQELMLKAAGYRVTCAESRREGERLLAEIKPDALIVDLMIDENDDGFALCYLAKKQAPNMPVIMTTGVAAETGIEFESVTEEERSWIKADVLLAKPVRSEQVIRELERLLEARCP